MTNYVTRDGIALRGASGWEVMEALRATSHSPCEDLDTFIRELANRATTQTGRYFRTKNLDNFLADLLNAGLIERVT